MGLGKISFIVLLYENIVCENGLYFYQGVYIKLPLTWFPSPPSQFSTWFPKHFPFLFPLSFSFLPLAFNFPLSIFLNFEVYHLSRHFPFLRTNSFFIIIVKLLYNSIFLLNYHLMIVMIFHFFEVIHFPL